MCKCIEGFISPIPKSIEYLDGEDIVLGIPGKELLSY